MSTENLLVELFVEELPPKALRKLGNAFASVLAEQLRLLGLATSESVVTAYASPRRLGAHISHIRPKADDKSVQQKLMPVSVGLDAAGQATSALLKRLQALGADVSDPAAAVAVLRRAPDGKAEALFHDSLQAGVTLDTGLQKALEEAIAKLPIPKVMSYQLQTDCELPGWTSVNFVRPAHGLVALHGSTVVPVKVLGLKAGNSTHGHRFEAAVDPVVLRDADSYEATLETDGAVIASFARRKAEVARQLAAAAARLGGGVRPIEDDALLDEVTALVERPNVLVCEFETEFLDVPQECLILTMKANQKYFPLLDAAGKLTNRFLVVSNISPEDASAVISGNERVVRPRLADAKFFFDQDRKKTLDDRIVGLRRIVYLNKLGEVGDLYSRMERVRELAKMIGQVIGGTALADSAFAAATLAKGDLMTDMVGEFPELQGVMGRYYALHDGLSEDVAFAIEDHYKPRFSGDELPRSAVGLVVALADKLEILVGMFGVGNFPSGDKDPFALRRHALGVVRILDENQWTITISKLFEMCASVFNDSEVFNRAAEYKNAERNKTGRTAEERSAVPRTSLSFAIEREKLTAFIYDRLSVSLRDQGYSSQEVDAVMSLQPQLLCDVTKRLAAVRAFATLPEAPALAAANKRIGNILKKALEVDPHVSEILLKEPAEIALHEVMKDVLPGAHAQFNAGDYTASLQTLAALRAPVDAFFDSVMVNAEELDMRLNRQGLLKKLHLAMNQVADLSRLAA